MNECGGFEIVFKTAANAKKGAEILKGYIASKELESYFWSDYISVSGKSIKVDREISISWSDYDQIVGDVCEVLNEKMPGKICDGEFSFCNETTGFVDTKRMIVVDGQVSFEDANSFEDIYDVYMNLASTTDDVDEIKEILINMGYDPDDVEEVCNSFDEECCDD